MDTEFNIEKNNIITEYGLFYANFSDRFRAGLATIEGSDCYSEYLVWLRENYGIKVGNPQPDSNGKMPEDSRACGIYIVNYQKYLSDLKDTGKNNIDFVPKSR